MSQRGPLRRYGKRTKGPTLSVRQFAELAQSPVRKEDTVHVRIAEDVGDDDENDAVAKLATQLTGISIDDGGASSETAAAISADQCAPRAVRRGAEAAATTAAVSDPAVEVPSPPRPPQPAAEPGSSRTRPKTTTAPPSRRPRPSDSLKRLTWAEVCPAGTTLTKMAEASSAEVYRVRNARGTSVLKAIRLASPLKAQTATQVRSGLVDEAAYSEADAFGELRIAEGLAPVPGFVVYKERYVVQGRAPGALVETHRAFHRKAKRADPARLQFYPSPTRYLDETRFLVVELGDAGAALEDFEIAHDAEAWDVFFGVAVALARAEALLRFEHRDLHEGNVCVRRGAARQAGGGPKGGAPKKTKENPARRFGASGLEVTILDYGLSRADCGGDGTTRFEHGGGGDASFLASSPRPTKKPSRFLTPPPEDGDIHHHHHHHHHDGARPDVVALDLSRDPALFASDHAPQCAVYRRMRDAMFLRTLEAADEIDEEEELDDAAVLARVDWTLFEPYTNVLWLAYLHQYLASHCPAVASTGSSPPPLSASFVRETASLWRHLDPDAPAHVPGFGSAGELVTWAVQKGWVGEEQLVGGGGGGGFKEVDGGLENDDDEEDDGGRRGDEEAEGWDWRGNDGVSILSEAVDLEEMGLRRSPRRKTAGFAR